MALLNFPTAPTPGQLFTIGSVTYIWNDTVGAWLKYNNGNQNFNRVTSTNIVVNSPTTATIGLLVNGSVDVTGTLNVDGTITQNGEPVLTGANFQAGTDIAFITSGTVTTVNNTSTLQTVTGRGATTTNVVYFNNLTESTSTTTGAVVISGGLAVGKRINSESLRIADTVFDSSIMSITSVAPTVIDSFSFNQFRSSKYLIQIDEGTGEGARCQATEFMLLVTNTGTVLSVEYGEVRSSVDLGGFEADFQDLGYDKIVSLKFISNDSTPKTVKVLRTAMAV